MKSERMRPRELFELKHAIFLAIVSGVIGIGALITSIVTNNTDRLISLELTPHDGVFLVDPQLGYDSHLSIGTTVFGEGPNDLKSWDLPAMELATADYVLSKPDGNIYHCVISNELSQNPLISVENGENTLQRLLLRCNK